MTIVHLEDLVLEDKTSEAIAILEAFANDEAEVSLKYDGAPAIIAGTDPADGQFFVSTKSFFNSTPRMCKSIRDIGKFYMGDLASKMILAFHHLPRLGIEGIIQGDYMYSQFDFRIEQRYDKPWLTFTPNTITYGIKHASHFADEVMRSQIGIAWHTRICGPIGYPTLTPDPSIVDSLNAIPEVISFSPSASMRRLNLSSSDRLAFTSMMTNIRQLSYKLDSYVMNELIEDPELVELIKMHRNAKIRLGKEIGIASYHLYTLTTYVKTRYEAHINKLKTLDAKANWDRKLKRLLLKLRSEEMQGLITVFQLQAHLEAAKNFLLEIASTTQYGELKPFKRLDGRLISTQHEGFVVNHRGQLVKLVDRLGFSMANFNNPKFAEA